MEADFMSCKFIFCQYSDNSTLDPEKCKYHIVANLFKKWKIAKASKNLLMLNFRYNYKKGQGTQVEREKVIYSIAKFSIPHQQPTKVSRVL